MREITDPWRIIRSNNEKRQVLKSNNKIYAPTNFAHNGGVAHKRVDHILSHTLPAVKSEHERKTGRLINLVPCHSCSSSWNRYRLLNVTYVENVDFFWSVSVSRAFQFVLLNRSQKLLNVINSASL